MTDDETSARRPLPTVGAVVGVVIAVLFGALFAWLAGLSLGAGGVVVTTVLMAGWAVFAAYRYGPDSADHHQSPAG